MPLDYGTKYKVKSSSAFKNGTIGGGKQEARAVIVLDAKDKTQIARYTSAAECVKTRGGSEGQIRHYCKKNRGKDTSEYVESNGVIYIYDIPALF